MKTPEERFWSKVSSPDENGCLLWLASKDRLGYGRFALKRVNVLAHRLSLVWAVGEPIDSSLQAAHSCGVRACVNPEHLRWATASENWSDRYSHGTDFSGEKHPQAKLTNEQVAQIRDMYATGQYTQTALGREFGVVAAHINFIIKGKTRSKG